MEDFPIAVVIQTLQFCIYVAKREPFGSQKRSDNLNSS